MHLSSINLENFKDLALTIPEILELIKLHTYKFGLVYKRIFLNFGVISFINKEMVSLFQLHTYKFGLVYKQNT